MTFDVGAKIEQMSSNNASLDKSYINTYLTVGFISHHQDKSHEWVYVGYKGLSHSQGIQDTDLYFSLYMLNHHRKFPISIKWHLETS